MERTGSDGSSTRWIAVVMAVVVAVASLLLAAPAGASTGGLRSAAACDPAYGCPPGPPPPTPNPSCSLSDTSAAPGEQVVATIHDAPVGATVTLTFDGTAVGQAVVEADSPGATKGSATIEWTVPADASPGEHSVVFTGAGVNCDATGGASFAVLGNVITKRPSSSSALARTGIEVAAFLAAAAVLLLVGAQLLRTSRRRRRFLAQHQNRVRRLERV